MFNIKSGSFRFYLSTLAISMLITTMIMCKGREETDSKRSNILIYVADDQYMESVGVYGANPSHTPNIDKLASEGMQFMQCFTPSSICTPNRGILLSGKYPLKNGAHANHSGFFDGIKSLPNYMKELGYRACIVGKDGIQKPSDLYEWEFRINKSKEHVPGADEPKHDRHRKTNYKKLEKFLSADDDRPFVIFHAASLPHSPKLNESLNGLKGYDANNFYMDYELGKDLELLSKYGLDNNTLVIYVNDNEAQKPRTKNTLYDTGIHVPMVVRWPGKVAAGSKANAMVSFLDFLPTIIEMAGGDVPKDLDGKSLLDVFAGKTDKHHEELFFSYTGVIVSKNGRNETPFPIRAYRNDQYKYIRYLNHEVAHPKGSGHYPEEELFDLESDPGEKNNLVASPELQDKLIEFREKIDTWMSAIGDRGIESELATLKKYPPVKGAKKKKNKRAK